MTKPLNGVGPFEAGRGQLVENALFDLRDL